MGNFLDDLGNFLDDTLGSPGKGKGGIWGALHSATTASDLNPLSSTGYKVDSGGLENFASTRTLPYQDLAGIVQKRDAGFNVIDVTPVLLSSNSDFNCSIPKSALFDKVGYEGDSDLTSGNMGTWRTLQIPLAGSFVRFTFTEGKINFANTINANNYKKPVEYDELLPTAYPEIWQSRTLLVQFDDPSGPIHLVNDGDSFELTFQTIFVSFKRSCARFSVTTGYNSRITTSAESKQMNSNLYAGPGIGIWSNPHRHAVPFCFTNNGNQSVTGRTSVGTSTTVAQNLFANTVNNPAGSVLGVATGWITSITATAVSTGGDVDAVLKLFVASPGNVLDKLIAVVPLNTNSAGSVASGSLAFASGSFNPAIPARFSLFSGSGEYLRAELINFSGSVSILVLWVINGYAFGQISDPNSGSPFVLDYCTAAPFPLDFSQQVNRI